MSVTAAALSLASAASSVSTNTTTGEAVTFWFLGPLAVAGALGVLFSRKAVHSALLLALTMLSLAVLYLAQDAPFLGVVQAVVYTGAVMMLFLFVLMLVGVDSADSLVETLRGQRIAAVIAAIGFAALLISSIGNAVVANVGLDKANSNGNVQDLADLIFSRYVFAFEVTSALLITAAMGAMVLAHRERHEPRATQRDLSEARFRGGKHPAPLPGPGIFARHNAVDTPALLPDGTAAQLSISRVLAARGDMRPVPGATAAPATTELARRAGDDDQ